MPATADQFRVEVEVVSDHARRAEPGLRRFTAFRSVEIDRSDQACGEILWRVTDETGPAVIDDLWH